MDCQERDFQGRVEGELAGTRGDQKMILAIPPKQEVPRLLRRLTPFVRSIAKAPEKPAAVKLDEIGLNFSISYQPGNRSSGWSHFSFTVPYSLTRNPVANRLKAKARQLKGSGFKGVTGVLLCDGDCDILRGLGYSTTHFSERDIVSHFFKRNTSISFVVFLTVRESYPPFSTPTRRHFRATVFSNPSAQFPCLPELLKLLELIPTLLPTPLQGPANALHQYAWEKHSGLSFYGGSSMTDREITLPARALIQLLAGTVELERFRKDHHFIPSKPGDFARDFFADQLKDGRTIESVQIERRTEDDDDWIVFVFGVPDPAISPFRSK